jgi:hypothetical protein
MVCIIGNDRFQIKAPISNFRCTHLQSAHPGTYRTLKDKKPRKVKALRVFSDFFGVGAKWGAATTQGWLLVAWLRNSLNYKYIY